LTRSRSSSACRGRLPLAVGAAEPDPDPGSVLVLTGSHVANDAEHFRIRRLGASSYDAFVVVPSAHGVLLSWQGERVDA